MSEPGLDAGIKNWAISARGGEPLTHNLFSKALLGRGFRTSAKIFYCPPFTPATSKSNFPVTVVIFSTEERGGFNPQDILTDMQKSFPALTLDSSGPWPIPIEPSWVVRGVPLQAQLDL